MFADVILPLPLHGMFTYKIPLEMQNTVGKGFRVTVPFGNRKHYTAIVADIHANAPAGVDVKEIHSLIDLHPVVNANQLKLWEWISFYYMCSLGDVYKAALPSAMKPQDFQEKFTPKTEIHLKLNPKIEQKYIPDLIGKAKKQQLLFDEISRLFKENNLNSVSKKKVAELPSSSQSALKGLIGKQLLQEFAVETGRLNFDKETTRKPHPLNQHQQQALQEITDCFAGKNTCLLHGVTSSGKTEIYIHLIEQMLAKGKQTLYLVPEIALTTQLTQRLREVFGNKLGIYHSKINDNERTEIWQKMLSDTPFEIIIGVRSSLFLPFQRLGLVIVDEEHETSYKQQDPAPRYHARDAATVLAQISDAKTLLGSATPSMESFHNAKTGKFGLVSLQKRFDDIELPAITFENTFELRRTKKMKSALAPALIEKIDAALQSGEQAILFRNRRGFAPMLECKLCGWTPKCRHCDVSLTFHKNNKELKCHYCGKTYKPVTECPVCRQKSVELIGMGTEKLEEEVSCLFPDTVIARMDTDTTRGKNAYEKIIGDFQENKVQILVGTQMLSKGLDFDKVSIVGIISADGLLNHPDFRSHERGFQLMMQAAGRAGRKNRQGAVIVQSADPAQPIYRYLQANDYEGFYNLQLAERKLFKYPPFCRLISIVLKSKDERKAESGGSYFARLLKKSLGEMVLGANKPIVSRVQQYHIREILLKLDNSVSPVKIRKFIRTVEDRFRENPDFKYVVLYYDVDVM